MVMESIWLLAAAVLLVALLYASVGHAGASGYIAVMTLFGMAPAEIRPTALTLNILVACLGTWQFWRAGRFSWALFWPFAVLAVPMAFVGGYLNLPAQVFKVLIGLVLLFSAVQLVRRPLAEAEPTPPSLPVSLGAGAGIGLLSGLTGTGGGIFLTPLLTLRGWARSGTAAGVSAPFILVNSMAGLAGNVSATQHLPGFILPLVGAVLVGGFIGAHLGSHRLPQGAIKRVLAVVLVIAGAKLLFA
ncbi:MAG TPA: hypothetical protein DC063_01420 [Arenimonas sp.]|nr:hypothetical protein [Arenimonas sp.]